MATTILARLAWVWIIIVGGLIITPGGIECIACGPVLTTAIGVISIALGVTGLAVTWRGRIG